MKARATAMVFCFLLLTAPGLRAGPPGERILHFDSRVEVQTNGGLTVTESIDVLALGGVIQHGIYRDFPQLYHGFLGLIHLTAFTVQSVTLDGQPEPWRVTGRENGVRVYIGSPDNRVAPGPHLYQLTYVTDHQLGYFADHDELYWNVTGNGWTLPMDAVTATVTLPPGASATHLTAYTGAQGDRGRDFTATNSANLASFTTTRPLPPQQGLTIVVEWPKGFVTPPSALADAAELIHNNPGPTLLTGAWLLTLVYFVVVWWRLGKNRRPGVIVPLYTPPPGFSPAAVRYLTRMGFDNKTFAAAVLNLAVRGALTINELKQGGSQKKVFILIPTRDAARRDLSPDEKLLNVELLYRKLPLMLDPSNADLIRSAQKKLKACLADQMRGSLFQTNLSSWLPGPLLLGYVLALAALWAPDFASASFALFGVGLGSLVLGLGWRRAVANGMSMLGASCFFGFLGVFGALFALELMHQKHLAPPVWTILLPLLLGVTNALFFNWLKCPTPAGRKLLDQIAGFKLYLSVAERDHLNLRDAPERTPRLFEQFLPYAYALGVEKIWQKKFAGVLAAAAVAPGQTAYSPAWYNGDSWQNQLATGAFVGTLGDSLAGAISSAASPPGSSSGGDGGGGGGGGGGGW